MDWIGLDVQLMAGGGWWDKELLLFIGLTADRSIDRSIATPFNSFFHAKKNRVNNLVKRRGVLEEASRQVGSCNVRASWTGQCRLSRVAKDVKHRDGRKGHEVQCVNARAAYDCVKKRGVAMDVRHGYRQSYSLLRVRHGGRCSPGERYGQVRRKRACFGVNVVYHWPKERTR
uniref:Uncharacterized protein n=1 Tax=Peronospora matthiolae TaxID=2874970 RepID=A0AAV1VE85_9STRA